MVYINIQLPSAHPATVPTNASQGDRETIQKPTKLGPKSIQKSIKMDAKIVQNRSQEASWRGLGRSWGHLGPKMAPRWPQEAPRPRKINSGPPSWEPSWRPKSIKNPSRGHRKGDRFFDHFWDRLLERFGANLAPTWLPKASSNGAKLDPKSMQVGVLI